MEARKEKNPDLSLNAGDRAASGQRTWGDYIRYTHGEHDQVLGNVFVETF